MGKNRVVEQNRCYHLVSRLAYRVFFLDDEEKDRAVALMRRVEAGVQASMSYCINRAVSISSDPFALPPCPGGNVAILPQIPQSRQKISPPLAIRAHLAIRIRQPGQKYDRARMR